MKITRKSFISGNTSSMEIDIEATDLLKWRSGMAIQRAMPETTPEEREFIKTGITAKEWDAAFGDEDED